MKHYASIEINDSLFSTSRERDEDLSLSRICHTTTKRKITGKKKKNSTKCERKRCPSQLNINCLLQNIEKSRSFFLMTSGPPITVIL